MTVLLAERLFIEIYQTPPTFSLLLSSKRANEELDLRNGFLCFCCHLARSSQPTRYLALVRTMATFGASTKVPVTARDPRLSLNIEREESQQYETSNMKGKTMNLPSGLHYFSSRTATAWKKKDTAQLLFHIIKNKSISGCQISFPAPFLPPDKYAVLKENAVEDSDGLQC